ncbi:hypothetical protein MJT46_005232 [Ovis ammon polii x Ovis aries]|nr:hypothetical protein MJT46_005232 [Ovis ammon polii x Ovis aries]
MCPTVQLWCGFTLLTTLVKARPPGCLLEARGLYRLAQEVQHNKVWPCTSGGAPGDPHPLSPPRPGPALPARSLEAQTLTSPPRWWSLLASPAPTATSVEEPRGAAMVLGVPGSLPLPSLYGHPYLLMAVSYHAPLPPAGEQLCLLVHCSEVPTSGQFQVRGSLCSISCWKPGSPPCTLSRDPWSSRARDRRDERHAPYQGATEDDTGRASSFLASVPAP